MKRTIWRSTSRLEYRHHVAIVYILGLFMEIMDTTIVNVAIPTLSETFQASHSYTEWTVISYLLSLVVFIPVSGWLGDRFGTRRVFLNALVLFVSASALCGFAGSLDQLIAFRALQGIGGGLLTPVGATMLYRAFPQEERVKAATAVFGAAVLAPAIGPVIGGVLVDELSWRWIFVINIPVGLATLIYASVVLREHREPYATRFDFGGFVLAGLSASGLVLSISLASTHGWSSTATLFSAGLAVLCGTLLLSHERSHPSPMLHLSLLRDRMFRTGNIVGAFVTAGYLGLIFLLPVFLQTVHGLSAKGSGLVMLPQSVGGLIGSQLAGRILYDKLGPRVLLVGGSLVSGAAGLVLATMDLDASVASIALLLFVRGFGIGPVFIALQTATYASVSVEETGQALAIYSTQRQMSAAVGAALGAAWLSARSADSLYPDIAAYKEAFVLVSCLLLVGGFISLRVRSQDVEVTMSGEQSPDLRELDSPVEV